MKEEKLSVEQMARNLLEIAVKENIVALATDQWGDPNPQARSSVEIIAVANLLAKYLRDRERPTILRATGEFTAEGVPIFG